jgi:hypothetical protein
MLRSSRLIGYDYKMVQLYAVRRDDERGVPASPYIVREAGLQVGTGREYQSSTSRSLPYSAGHVQLPNRVLLLHSPCASRHQVSCSASRVVSGAHRVVGPGTHRGSGPREVHTTAAPQHRARPRSSPPPLSTVPPLEPATASCKLRPAAYQNELLPTFPRICNSSPTVPRPLHRAHATRIPAAAATVPGRRRRPSPALSPPQPSTGIGPLGPKAPPSPVPGRPRPAVGRNLSGPPLAGRPGATLQRADSFQGPPRKRKTSIVFAIFLILVNCVENHRNTRKMQNKFC